MVYATIRQVNLANNLGVLGFIGGCMNAGKTSEIDTVLDRANELQLGFLPFSYEGDTRGNTKKLVAGRKDRNIEIPCKSYHEDNPEEIYRHIDEADERLRKDGRYAHVLVFDEAQLPDYKKFIPILQKLREYNGKSRLPIAVGLDRDFRGRMYEISRFLEGEQGTVVVKIEGFCKAHASEKGPNKSCGALATRTQRVISRGGLEVPEFPFVIGGDKTIYGCVPAPHWDETRQVEGANEATYYVPVCSHHHRVPGKDLVREIYDFFNNNRCNGGVPLQKIRDEFNREDNLDSILKWLTLEGGLEIREGKLRPREVTVHPVDGYLIAQSPDEIMRDEPETIYTPNQ